MEEKSLEGRQIKGKFKRDWKEVIGRGNAKDRRRKERERK